MKIKELIDFKPLKTVIKLDPESSDEDKRSLFDSFILTPDIEKALNAILSTMTHESGQGYFLKGNFGSGKSHFLAFLDYFFSNKKDGKIILEQSKKLAKYKKSLEAKKIFTISISLLDYRADSSIEDILFNNIEKKLYKLNIKETLIPETYLVESFEKYFKKDLIEFSKENYESLDFEDKIKEIKKFILLKKDFPFLFKSERKLFIDKLFEILEANNYSSILLLIDELSEYLKSKPDSENLNEDVRFLQFIGEATNEKKFFIIGSMQESIDEISEINSYIMKRISDRYKIRLQLSADHSRQVILDRLLKKNDAQIEKIKLIYEDIKKVFSQYEVSKDIFIQSYPVDINVFDLLDAVVSLFSKTRGALDFVYRTLESHLDDNAVNLIGPELIFDHFLNNMQENPETNDYIDVVYKYFQSRIDKIFKDKNSVELANKVIKFLILIKICKFKDYFTLKELAHLIRFKITDLGGGYNYEFLSENILEELCKNSDYIIKEKRDSILEDRYRIELELNINSIFENKKKETIKLLKGKEKNILWESFSLYNSSFLPLSELKESIDDGLSYTINWFNSKRKVKVWLRDFGKIDDEFLKFNKKLIEDEEITMVFIIGFPTEVEAKKNILFDELSRNDQKITNNFVFIIPDEIKKEELEVFLEASSIKKIINDTEESSGKDQKNLKRLAEERYDDILYKIRSIFERLYLPLTSYHAEKKFLFENDKRPFLFFEKELEKAASIILNHKYPAFPEYSPKVEFITKGEIFSLKNNFIEKGEILIKKAEAIGISLYIEGILAPMKLVKKKSGLYLLNIAIEDSEILKSFFNYLESGINSPPIILKKMSESSLGLIKEQFVLLFFSLLYSGYINIIKDGKSFPLNKLTVNNIFDIDEIRAGEIIDDYAWDFFSALDILSISQINTKNILLQKQIWDTLISYKSKALSKLELIKQGIDNLKGYKAYKVLEKSSVESIINILDKLLSSIKTSYSPKDGLEHFYKSLYHIDDINKILEKFENIYQFFTTGIQKYVYIYNYVDDELFISNTPEYQYLYDSFFNLKEACEEINNIIYNKSLDELNEKLKVFIGEYTEEYSKFHGNIFNKNKLNAIKKMLAGDRAKMLEKLLDIQSASVENNYNRVNNRIKDIEEQFCDKTPASILNSRNRCYCEVKLGGNYDIFQNVEDELQKSIEQGIREYIEYFQKPEIKEKIEAYIFSIQNENNIEDIEKIKKIIAGKDTPLALYMNLFTDNVIEIINSAIYKRNIKVKEINLIELLNRFNGTRLDKNKIYEIINDYLDNENDDALYQFTNIKNIPKTFSEYQEKAFLIKDKFINIGEFVKNSLKTTDDFAYFILKNKANINLLRNEAFKLLVEENKYIKEFDLKFKSSKIILIINNVEYEYSHDDEIYSAALSHFFIHYLMDLILNDLFNLDRSFSNEKELNSKSIIIEYINLNFFFNFMSSEIIDFLNKHNDFYSYSVMKNIEEVVSFNSNDLSILDSFLENKNLLSNENVFWNKLGLDKSLFIDVINIKRSNEFFSEIYRNIDVILVIDSLSIDLIYLLSENLMQQFEITGYFFLINDIKTDTETFRKYFFKINDPFDEAEYKIRYKDMEVFFDADRTDVQYTVPEIAKNEKYLLFYNLVDKKIHNSNIPYKELLSELKSGFKNSFSTLIDKIPADKKILLLSDHGFKLNLKNNKITYTHGGSSLKESLTMNFVLKRQG